MSGAHIADGDLLIVEEDEDPPDGTVVVALIGNGEEVTVKRLYRAGETLRLRPENGEHEDLVSCRPRTSRSRDGWSTSSIRPEAVTSGGKSDTKPQGGEAARAAKGSPRFKVG